jgi:hypothetical protein
MTETQAREFLAKCESRLLWRKVGDENKVIKVITRNFRGGFFLGLFWLGLSAGKFFNLNLKHENDLTSYYFEPTMITSMLIIALAMFGFSIWILVRMRQVHLALRGKI